MMNTSNECSDNEQNFARNFKPTFNASELVNFCKDPSKWNKTKLNFLKKFYPFSGINLYHQSDLAENRLIDNQKNNFSHSQEKYLSKLTKEFKNTIFNSMKESVSLGYTFFNDEQLIKTTCEKFSEKIESHFETNAIENKQENSTIQSRSGIENIVFNDERLVKDTCNKLESHFETNSSMNSFSSNEIEKKEENSTIQSKAIMQKITTNPKFKFYVSTQRGKILEKHVIENYNKNNNCNFIQDKQLKLMDFKDFKISGIIDAYDATRKIVLEIKTRNKLINKVNVKERKQALTYMKLLNCEQCWIVEHGPNDEQNCLIVKWDEEEFENEILNKLKIFCEYCRGLTRNQFIDLNRQFK